MWANLLQHIQAGDFKSIARCISLVENEVRGFEDFLTELPVANTPIIGITGPPGAGKSTLVDALIKKCTANNKSVAVLCVDPSSPFNYGSLLGDRIRMSQWFNEKNVFIRSLATRGSLGGLHPKIIEITDILKNAPFDYIIVETVGVGQSEIEIVGLADVTIVTLVPEAGDEVQTMKAGLMEIANIFVVNKCDRPNADLFLKNLRTMLAPAFNQQQEIKILATTASKNEGINDLYAAIEAYLKAENANNKKSYLYAERAFTLIQQYKMKGIDKAEIVRAIEKNPTSNLYKLIKQFL
jgi:LAO/AO transport system kinase